MVKNKESRQKKSPPSLYIPLNLKSEAVLNGNFALGVCCWALSWCGVILHRSMRHMSIWEYLFPCLGLHTR